VAGEARAGRRRPRIDFGAFARLTELADYFVPFAIRAVCELGIPDRLADGPRTVEDLAAATDAHAPSLHRVLRVLAGKGVFVEGEGGTFALGALGELLGSDHPLSLRDAYLPMPADAVAWAHLVHSLRTGEPAFEHVHGQGLWEYLADRPEESARFDRGMQAMTRVELRALMAAYDWGALGKIADVGGGNGAFLAGLLERQPALRGVLFDLPHVVAGAPAVLAEAGVADRCEIVAGSFFDRATPGAGAYVLKRIVYAWDDERARALLRAVRDAMAADSRILVVEPVAGVAQSAFADVLDVVMLAVDGGRVRTPDELGRLFGEAGLELTAVVPTMLFPIVEGRPA
jgi:hypothetical protein